MNIANEHLATYLNDHLAGSVVALELLETLEASHTDKPLVDFFARLRMDIEADRQELQALMDRLQITESSTRKATAWLAEKVTELKLKLDDRTNGDLRLFESLEALSLGIEGKRSLWLALSAVARATPELKLVDYDRLAQRAEEQRSRVEWVRLDTAKKVFAPAAAANAEKP